MNAEMVNVLCNDGVVMTVELDKVQKCGTIKNLMEDLGAVDNQEIPISVSSETFKRIMDNVNTDFSGMSAYTNETLIDIILATNYLECKDILESACKLIADQIKGKTTEEIRTLFDLEDDLTPEEKEEIAREMSVIE